MECGRSDLANTLMSVKAKVNDNNLIPLKLEIKPQQEDKSEEEDNNIETDIKLTEAQISERDWKIKQVHRQITEQLKTKGKETLD